MSDGHEGPRFLERVAAEHGTPFFLYDFEELEAIALRLRAALPQRLEICFAVKANPSLAVVRLFASLGLGAEIASGGELELALVAGVPPTRIVMAGPAKSDNDLKAAVAAGIAAIHVEGERELDRLQWVAEELGRAVAVGLRVRPHWHLEERTRIIGGSAKFGFSTDRARAVLVRRDRWPMLRFQGLHVFDASNVLDVEALVANAGRVLELAYELHREHGLPLGVVDFGGGLGVPYASDQAPLDLRRLGDGLGRMLQRAAREPACKATRFVVEPGRYLVATAGIYVARVVETKQGPEGVVALTDGGCHHLLRPALVGGAAHPVRLLRTGGRPGGALVPVTLAGPLCTALDVLAGPLKLPRPRVGDLVVVESAGAYGYTESMPLFLSHPWAAELGRRGDRVERLRRPPTVRELLAAQTAPNCLVEPTDVRTVARAMDPVRPEG